MQSKSAPCEQPLGVEVGGVALAQGNLPGKAGPFYGGARGCQHPP